MFLYVPCLKQFILNVMIDKEGNAKIMDFGIAR